MSLININRLILVIVGLIILNFGCDIKVTRYDTDAEIAKLMEQYDLPSISACVIKDRSIVWKQSYGYSNRENQIEANEETIYHVASISKLFIVTAIMQLEEQGLVNISSDINEYIPISIRNPNLPEVPITLKMLLTHSSGIAWPQTYAEALGLWEHFEPDKAPQPSEWIPQFLIPSGRYYNSNIWKSNKPADFELYSNIGSNVLAYVVEQVTGQSFREYCKENIFATLNMHNTSYNYSDLDNDKIASLYLDDNSIHRHFDDRLYASGGLKTTISDLSKFLMAYLNGGVNDGTRILKEETVVKILNIQNTTSGICLIWRASLGGWFGHTGGMVGTATIAEIHPKSKTAFIIFCNKHSSVVYQGHEIYGMVKQKANDYIK